MVNTLEHHVESPSLIGSTQGERVCVLWDVAQSDESLITAVDEAITIHIAVLQVAHLHVAIG